MKKSSGISLVFKNKRYLVSGILITILFYLLNVIIVNFRNLISLFNTLPFLSFLKSIYLLSIHLNYSVENSGFISLIILSILTGILLPLLVFRYRNLAEAHSNNQSILTSLGLFLGVIVPGCASCGIGLAAVLGLTSTIAFLPFKGLELSIFAIILLSYSIFKVSKSINANCELPKEN